MKQQTLGKCDQNDGFGFIVEVDADAKIHSKIVNEVNNLALGQSCDSEEIEIVTSSKVIRTMEGINVSLCIELDLIETTVKIKDVVKVIVNKFNLSAQQIKVYKLQPIVVKI